MSSEYHEKIYEREYERVYNRGRSAIVDAILAGRLPVQSVNALAHHRAHEAANKAVRRGTTEPWENIRQRIWERDGGVCDVCGDTIPIEHYDCGHIVDRVCDGTDLDDNLVVMCNVCNRLRKPLHETPEQYYEWRDKVRAVRNAYL